jgi:phenylacetaldehyde dehydrogenase
MFVDGRLVDARSNRTFETINPATGETLATVAQGDAADIDVAVKAARQAFDVGPWTTMNPSQRGRIVWKIGDVISEHLEELAQLETLDNGKPLTVARAADVPDRRGRCTAGLDVGCFGWDGQHGRVGLASGRRRDPDRRRPLGWL